MLSAGNKAGWLAFPFELESPNETGFPDQADPIHVICLWSQRFHPRTWYHPAVSWRKVLNVFPPLIRNDLVHLKEIVSLWNSSQHIGFHRIGLVGCSGIRHKIRSPCRIHRVYNQLDCAGVYQGTLAWQAKIGLILHSTLTLCLEFPPLFSASILTNLSSGSFSRSLMCLQILPFPFPQNVQ